MGLQRYRRCARRIAPATDDGANSITVPGIVDAWCACRSSRSAAACRRARTRGESRAHRCARVPDPGGSACDTASAPAARRRGRLGAVRQVAGACRPQPALAGLLERIGPRAAAFYEGAAARAIARCVQALGGALAEADLAAHETVIATPIQTTWGDWRLDTQPPMSQGVLLNMAVQSDERLGDLPAALNDHVAIELTNAAFAFRDDVARGEALLAEPLPIDLEKASHRGGPRAYLHTAGVAAVDADGWWSHRWSASSTTSAPACSSPSSASH